MQGKNMFGLAISVGIYAYIIFCLGLLGLLYRPLLIMAFVVWLLCMLFLYGVEIKKYIQNLYSFSFLSLLLKQKIFLLLFGIFLLQVVVNIIGALGPELAFDALWYHLTLPKLYLQEHAIIHIPGGLLYYSDMPKLTELIYIFTLAIGNEITAKIIHFIFGLLTCFALYQFTKEYLPSVYALLSVLIFYSNLVVAWESTTAYIDLARTFFEVMALWGFILWVKKRKQIWFIKSAIMLGLAVSTKLLALGSLVIFSVLFVIDCFQQRKKLASIIPTIIVYCSITLLIPLPWFLFSLVNTGNPVYPFFTTIYKTTFDINLLNPFVFLQDTWILFTRADDPISPLYIMFFPLFIFLYKKLSSELKLIALYSFLSILIWYISPRTGGGRFIIPYLPALSLITAWVLYAYSTIKQEKIMTYCLLVCVLMSAFITLGYRSIANMKFLPVVTGKETKESFLASHLNFSFGDFYDIDNYFKKNIKQTDKVLLYGFHNLYYVDFPFIDASWVEKGATFNYIATQNTTLPKRFRYWNLVYANPKTNVKLYSLGGTRWVY